MIATKAVTTLAGSSGGHADASGTSAKFKYPSDVSFDPSGVYALVAD
eukprot:COSAG05_NODE_24071_length_254_cov_0.612903_1_plen_46_part_10